MNQIQLDKLKELIATTPIEVDPDAPYNYLDLWIRTEEDCRRLKAMIRVESVPDLLLDGETLGILFTDKRVWFDVSGITDINPVLFVHKGERDFDDFEWVITSEGEVIVGTDLYATGQAPPDVMAKSPCTSTTFDRIGDYV